MAFQPITDYAHEKPPETAAGIDHYQSNDLITPAQLERLSPARLMAIQIVVGVLEVNPSFILKRANDANDYISKYIRKTIYTISQQLTRRA